MLKIRRYLLPIILILCLVFTITGFCDWISPSSFIDPDSKWDQEVKVYDWDINTAAYTLIPTSKTWSSYVEYTIASISCDSIRFNALYSPSNINSISIDVYYSAAWNNIYEGSYTNHAWVEKAIGSTQDVTAVRIKFYSKSAGITAYLYELELNDLNSGARGGGDLFGTYDQRIKLTIDNTKIDSDLTWFPKMIKLTSGQMEEVFAEFDSDDDFDRCAITLADEETQIYGDCERFDDSESVAEYHVAKTGIITDADAAGYLYFYYDKDAAHNTTYISKSGGTAAQSVWDGNFKAVYHMAGTGESPIDVGSGCVDRASTLSGNITFIDLANPADFTGRITNVAIWAAGTSMANVKVATFYKVGDNYTARSASGDLGTVAYGAVRNFAVNLDVVAGDYIGVYWTTGNIETSTSGGSGVVYLAGDQTACVNATFALYADYAISLYGTGVTVNILDSTSNNNDGWKKGVNEPVEAAGKVGQGQDFAGDDDYVKISDNAGLDIASEITLECIVDFDELDEAKRLIDKYYDGSTRAFSLTTHWTDLDEIGFVLGVANGSSATTLQTTDLKLAVDTDYYIAGVLDGDTMSVYKNGVASTDTLEKLDDIGTNNEEVRLGIYYNESSNMLDGIMDEVRISDVGRSAAWLKATYNSSFDTLLTYGDEETGVRTNVLFMFSDF